MADDMSNSPLWCLHLRGPDDVFAAPSKEAAENAARYVNEHFANHEVKPNAVVAMWPYSAESHAESLEDWAEQWGAPTTPPPPRLVPDRPSDAAIATVAKMIADTLGRPAAPNILELAAAIVAEVRHGQ